MCEAPSEENSIGRTLEEGHWYQTWISREVVRQSLVTEQRRVEGKTNPPTREVSGKMEGKTGRGD